MQTRSENELSCMPIFNAAVMLFTDESKNRRSELGQGHRRSELGASGSTRSELGASVPPGISFDHLIFITINLLSRLVISGDWCASN